ncbi:MAG: hypothetical protein NTX88_08835 [Candidatus Atribacteria bacterium]|nr:hypothetical protein [Candidatus Atribacteria bacterium]
MKRTVLLLVLVLVAAALLMPGCTIVVPIPDGGGSGTIRICGYDRNVWGTVYIDDVNVGYIDGDLYTFDPDCVSRYLTLGVMHQVELYNSTYGDVFEGVITPSYDGQRYYIHFSNGYGYISGS